MNSRGRGRQQKLHEITFTCDNSRCGLDTTIKCNDAITACMFDVVSCPRCLGLTHITNVVSLIRINRFLSFSEAIELIGWIKLI